MRSFLFLLGLVSAALGGAGAFISRPYMEDHPELQVRASLAILFGQTEQIPFAARMHILFSDYSMHLALAGAFLLALAYLWPRTGRSFR